VRLYCASSTSPHRATCAERSPVLSASLVLNVSLVLSTSLVLNVSLVLSALFKHVTRAERFTVYASLRETRCAFTASF